MLAIAQTMPVLTGQIKRTEQQAQAWSRACRQQLHFLAAALHEQGTEPRVEASRNPFAGTAAAAVVEQRLDALRAALHSYCSGLSADLEADV